MRRGEGWILVVLMPWGRHSDRFCASCEQTVRTAMRSSGYLEKVVPRRKHRSDDEKELIEETKFGVGDWRIR